MLKRRYERCKSQENWKSYKANRNKVFQLRRKSLGYYIKMKCTEPSTSNGKEFWKVIKPIASFKNKENSSNIMLLENNNIISNPHDVSNILNKHYVSMAKNIGQPDEIPENSSFNDIIQPHIHKECITRIKQHVSNNRNFTFAYVKQSQIYEKLKNLNVRKSTGFDQIPPKLVKLGAEQLSGSLTYMVNECIRTSSFPDLLKRAEVTPIYKKDDMLLKTNYRPVSILPCLSKIFEGLFLKQLTEYFDTIFSPVLSGFRKKHSCQTVLLRYVENCKQSLDTNEVYGTLLTDLSMAFDCLPHRLLITKLQAYGLSEASCMLISCYFQSLYQRVKVGNVKSDWMQITKGCPQGSLFGPLAFNIFSNDLLLLAQDLCDTYNYADDNSFGISGKNVNEVIYKLKEISSLLLDWFDSNYLQANPKKFQFILHDKIIRNVPLSINESVDLKSQSEVKLLGIKIDAKLSFSQHINELCRKAGRHINVLGRLSKSLSVNGKFQLYNTFIMSNFNFCPVIWHYCSMSDLCKIENVQKRALKIILKDYNGSYSKLRQQANRSLLYVDRLRQIIIEVFKIYYTQCPVYLDDLITKTQHTYNTHNINFLVPSSFNTIKYGKMSFKYDSSLLWNSLPTALREASNFKVLKRF